MSHSIQLPTPQGVVDHLEFFGRRNSNSTRHIGYNYGIFASTEAADNYSTMGFESFNSRDLLDSTGRFGSRAEFMDQFFLDEQSGAYAMDDQANFLHLQRLLTGNFTEAEYQQTFGLRRARQVLAGAQFVVGGQVAFTVEALPETRIEE